MPVHEWRRVGDGAFHDFHYSWVLEIKRALKRGVLPPDYYVMAEQVGGDLGTPDVVTLHRADPDAAPAPPPGTATLTETPPVAHARTRVVRDPYARKQRTLVIRHTSGDRIVAMVEVLSPGNKSSKHAMRSLLDKVVAALDAGVHLLIVDVHPPGPRDPRGIHGAILDEITAEQYTPPAERPLAAASYVGGLDLLDSFVMHFAVGEAVPDAPLFLTRENYVRVPLEAPYMAAWEDVPAPYQATLSAPA
jgi:hypothetical protein